MLPAWNDVQSEMLEGGPAVGAPADFDGVRRAKIRGVESITGRPLVIYAVDFTNSAKTGNNSLALLINLNDRDGFVEATRRLPDGPLDILVQSPGGLAEAVESIVDLLRSRFAPIRFIIPSLAKSAAAMLALSGEQLLLTSGGELGPIDPQMPNGRGGYAPAQAVLDQFDQAKADLKGDASLMPAWLPILQQYGPSLLQECRNHLALSEELVAKWLEQFMFNGQAGAQARAAEIARKLNDHNLWRSHARRVDLAWLTGPDAGLNVVDLSSAPDLHEAVWGLHLAISLTFTGTAAFKIVENGQGDALIGMAQFAQIMLPTGLPQPPPFQPAPPGNN